MMVRSMKNVQVARLLAYISGMVNHQLLLQSEYLIAENKDSTLALAGTSALD